MGPLRLLSYMTTTIAANTKVDSPALTGLVGLVRIFSDDSAGSDRLLGQLSRWLAQNGWAEHVVLEQVESVAGCEIVFLPGEHQSNPPVKLAFHAVPDVDRVLHRLTHWLYELM